VNLTAFWRAYKTEARQLAFVAIAREWHAAGITPHAAADWANRGFLPHEALPLIADGITPELVGAVEVAIGEDDELAGLTLNLLHNGG
jgi:hypothetical protein